MNSERVVFCDFDGTITSQDTFVKVVEKFAPKAANSLFPAIFRQQLSLKDGIGQTLGSISADRYPQILELMSQEPIRPGFPELIDFLNNSNIPLIIISGGLTGMVQSVLENHQLTDKVAEIHAGDVDLSGERLKPFSAYESLTEFVDKVQVMEQYPAQEQIAIGDSVTDIKMALASDLVFARDRLKTYLEAEQKPYVPWQDFFEIKDYLAAHWQI